MNAKIALSASTILVGALVGFIGYDLRRTMIPDRLSQGQQRMPSPYPTLDEMVGTSPVIFAGTVVGMRYGRHSESPQPFTFVRFVTIDFLRRDAAISLEGGALVISYMGGVGNEMHLLDVSTQPHFEMGRRYLVFLRGGRWRLSPIPGGNQGFFELRGPPSDPFVFDPSGKPIAGFKNGYRVISERNSGGVQEGDEPLRRSEEEIPLDQARRLGLTSERQLDARELATKEAQDREQEQRRDTIKILPEPDPRSAIEQGWSRVMKLSDIRTEIVALTKSTLGKYPGFERVYLAPASRPGTIRPMGPPSPQR